MSENLIIYLLVALVATTKKIHIFFKKNNQPAIMPVIINFKPIHHPLHPLVFFPPAINQTHRTRWAAVYVLLQGTQAHVTTTVVGS